MEYASFKPIVAEYWRNGINSDECASFSFCSGLNHKATKVGISLLVYAAVQFNTVAGVDNENQIFKLYIRQDYKSNLQYWIKQNVKTISFKLATVFWKSYIFAGAIFILPAGLEYTIGLLTNQRNVGIELCQIL